MKKQVVFISGGEVFETRDDFKTWLAGPESDFMLPQPGVETVTFWSRNLQEDLGEEYEVLSISMPLKQHARYDEWKIWFEKHIGFMQDEVVLVGWSLGANFFIKYLSEEIFEKEISSLHLVAGCTNEFETKNNFKIQSNTIYVYHSEDDDIVSIEEAHKIIKNNSEVNMTTFTDRNHFLQPELPELIKNIKIS